MSDIKAYIAKKDIIKVQLSKNFYNGESSYFRLRNYEGFSEKLKLINKVVFDTYIEYDLANPYFDLSKEYLISDEHNMSTPLEVSFYVRTEEFNQKYYYNQDDLGVSYTKDASIFKVWSPIATQMLLKTKDAIYPMIKDEYGVWSYKVLGDCDGLEYTYLVRINGKWDEAVDPYAYSSTPNGTKSVVIDLDRCDIDLNKDNLPILKNAVDAIVSEVHIRDLSISNSSGLKNKGKFIAFTEEGKTVNSNPTGLDYFVSLGVTHLQLLPFYDFGSVDELNQLDYYNWGYDPVQYNVPEGSYASNVLDPYSRIIDCKKMIAAIHKKGLRIVMDVVYNHMFGIEMTAFHKLMPYYYFRYGQNGEISNGSFCGNDFDSLQPMASKFIVDSIKRWVKFYGVDGFRFDLMGIIDINTMNRVYDEAKKIEPSIIIYGEGWNMPTLMKDELKACQFNNDKLLNIGFFNDRFRDIVKGATMAGDVKVKGYATGVNKKLNVVCDTLRGTCQEVNYGYHYTSPNQVVNYVECHDNHTVWDKMQISNYEEDEATRKKRQKLMISMVLLAQGMPFLHAGQEFCRTKNLDHNSYMSSDEVNKLDYNLMEENMDLVLYTKALIAFRKRHNEFRYNNSLDVSNFVKTNFNHKGIIKYYVKDYLVIFNPNNEVCKVVLNDQYSLVDFDDNSYECGKTLMVQPISTTILKKFNV